MKRFVGTVAKYHCAGFDAAPPTVIVTFQKAATHRMTFELIERSKFVLIFVTVAVI